MPALYTSFRFQTAWLEAQQGFPLKAQPMTLCAYDVDCADVLDLTDDPVREEHEVSLSELSCAWEDLAALGRTPPSWSLATRLVAAGTAAIVVPSFARGATREDVNAVFWRWSSVLPHQVRVIDDDGRLPRDAASWA